MSADHPKLASTFEQMNGSTLRKKRSLLSICKSSPIPSFKKSLLELYLVDTCNMEFTVQTIFITAFSASAKTLQRGKNTKNSASAKSLYREWVRKPENQQKRCKGTSIKKCISKNVIKRTDAKNSALAEGENE